MNGGRGERGALLADPAIHIGHGDRVHRLLAERGDQRGVDMPLGDALTFQDWLLPIQPASRIAVERIGLHGLQWLAAIGKTTASIGRTKA